MGMLLTLGFTAGTAILSKIEPVSTTQVLPNHPNPGAIKGRLITLEFEKFYLIGTYVTNSGQGLKVTLFHDMEVQQIY